MSVFAKRGIAMIRRMRAARRRPVTVSATVKPFASAIRLSTNMSRCRGHPPTNSRCANPKNLQYHPNRGRRRPFTTRPNVEASRPSSPRRRHFDLRTPRTSVDLDADDLDEAAGATSVHHYRRRRRAPTCGEDERALRVHLTSSGTFPRFSKRAARRNQRAADRRGSVRERRRLPTSQHRFGTVPTMRHPRRRRSYRRRQPRPPSLARDRHTVGGSLSSTLLCQLAAHAVLRPLGEYGHRDGAPPSPDRPTGLFISSPLAPPASGHRPHLARRLGPLLPTAQLRLTFTCTTWRRRQSGPAFHGTVFSAVPIFIAVTNGRDETRLRRGRSGRFPAESHVRLSS